MLKHRTLLLSVLLLWSSSISAEPLSFDFNVTEAASAAPVVNGAVEHAPLGLYARLSARAATAPGRAAGLNMGFRPRIGRLGLDFAYSRAPGTCGGSWSAGMSRPVGRATLQAQVAFDPAAEVSRASTEASIPLSKRLSMRGRLEGRYAAKNGEPGVGAEIALARTFSAKSRLDVRLYEASDAPGRAELSLRRAF